MTAGRRGRRESVSPDPGQSRTIFSLGERETEELGRSLARTLRGGELILLDGELGLGKTVLARGIAAGSSTPSTPHIISPTVPATR